MPVLRVAVTEPDFFATTDHPARKLIDRMGACVMGFEAGAKAAGAALEKEIRRVVQVVEAYPDTGRRVFQTVLTEFEKFLEHYFRSENEVTRAGVSLAQQVEQRETLAVRLPATTWPPSSGIWTTSARFCPRRGAAGCCGPGAGRVSSPAPCRRWQAPARCTPRSTR